VIPHLQEHLFHSASLSFFFKRLGYWSRFSLRFPQWWSL
jgi:hypothetical protein